MRTQKAAFNSFTNIVTQTINLIIKFVSRTFFIKYIGIDYLGLNGLFVNLLGILSMAELGIGIAFGTILYKPLAENDYDQINAFVKVCRKVFTIIGIIILTAAICITPFIQLFIKDSSLPILQIRLYFILFAVSSSVTYFNYHKCVLLSSDQKGYIEKTVLLITNIITISISILLMIFTGNYIYYLLILIITAIISNLVISLIASKKYAHILGRKAMKLDEANVKHVKKNVYALVLQKIGGVLVTYTDNLIISSMIGLTILGLYSNYSMILVSAVQVFKTFLNGISASVGNLWAEEPVEKVYEVFKKYRLISFWIYALLSIGFMIMVQPFITLWLGEDYLLGFGLVIVLSVNIYLTNMRDVVLTFSIAKELYYHERYKSLFEAAVNLVTSLILVQYLGIMGVFIGTAIGTLTVCFWFEPLVLYKYGFKKKLSSFFINYALMFALYILTGALTYFACMYFKNGILNFTIRLLICFIIPNIIFFLVFFKTDEFKYYINSVKNVIRRKKT